MAQLGHLDVIFLFVFVELIGSFNPLTTVMHEALEAKDLMEIKTVPVVSKMHFNPILRGWVVWVAMTRTLLQFKEI